MVYENFNMKEHNFVGHLVEPDNLCDKAVLVIMGGEKSVLPGIKIAERFADYGFIGLAVSLFHGLRHTSVTYKLKLSGGDIKAVQGDSGHAQADMVTEVYGHILDEDRRKNAQLLEEAFYKKGNLNPDMKDSDAGKQKIEVPAGVDAEALMKVLNNPEMVALLAGLAKGITV